MKEKRDVQLYILDMLQAIDEVNEFVKDIPKVVWDAIKNNFPELKEILHRIQNNLKLTEQEFKELL